MTKEETKKRLLEIIDNNPEFIDKIKDSFLANIIGDIEDIVKTTHRLKELMIKNGIIPRD